MSQRPRAGDKAKTASSANAAKDPAPKIEPVKIEAASKPTPSLIPDPVVVPTAVVQPAAVPESEPVMSKQPQVDVKPSPEIAEPPVSVAQAPVPMPVKPPMPAPAKPMAVVSQPISAVAHGVAAVTAKAVEAASAIEPAKSTISQGMKSMMKSTEDLVAFGQANMEAFVKSGQIWSAGVQELTKQIASSAKAQFDESVSTFKAISTARSVKEAIDLQSTFAKAALEKAMAESNKLTDASIKLTEQTLAPITARVTVAVESFGKTH